MTRHYRSGGAIAWHGLPLVRVVLAERRGGYERPKRRIHRQLLRTSPYLFPCRIPVLLLPVAGFFAYKNPAKIKAILTRIDNYDYKPFLREFGPVTAPILILGSVAGFVYNTETFHYITYALLRVRGTPSYPRQIFSLILFTISIIVYAEYLRFRDPLKIRKPKNDY